MGQGLAAVEKPDKCYQSMLVLRGGEHLDDNPRRTQVNIWNNFLI